MVKIKAMAQLIIRHENEKYNVFSLQFENGAMRILISNPAKWATVKSFRLELREVAQKTGQTLQEAAEPVQEKHLKILAVEKLTELASKRKWGRS